jgi:hypothetical protein
MSPPARPRPASAAPGWGPDREGRPSAELLVINWGNLAEEPRPFPEGGWVVRPWVGETQFRAAGWALRGWARRWATSDRR